MPRFFPVLFALLALVSISGCSRVDSPQPGAWRGVIELDEGDAPLLLDVALQNDAPVLHVIRGGERAPLTNIWIAEQTLTAQLPDSNMTLRVKLYRDRMEGKLLTHESDGDEAALSFSARRGQGWWFHEKPATDNADVAGHWELEVEHEDGALDAALRLIQSHDRLTGTLLLPSREQYPVDGQVHGDDVQLVSLAGDTVELYQLRVDEQGELRGTFQRGEDVQGTAHARRTPDVYNDMTTIDEPLERE